MDGGDDSAVPRSVGYRARGQYFGDVARSYDSARQRSFYDRWKWRQEHLAVALALAELAPVASVLDLPTGTGRFLGQLARRAPSARTVGADISLDMLDLARRRSIDGGTPTAAGSPVADRSRGCSTALVAAEAERLPFADGTFDLVLSIRFFQHLPTAAVAPILGELHRVSRRGVLFQAPLTHRLSPAVRLVSRWLHRATRGRVGSAVRQARSRHFPVSRVELETLLAAQGLRVRSSRVVTWRGGQLRLLHVAR